MSNTDMGRLVSNSPRPHMIQQDPDTVLQWLQDVMKASDIHLYYGKIYDDYANIQKPYHKPHYRISCHNKNTQANTQWRCIMTTQTTHHRTSTMICHHIYDLELLFLLLITRIPHPMLIYFLYYIKYQHILPRRETRITHMINIYTVDGIVPPQRTNQTKRPAPTTHHTIQAKNKSRMIHLLLFHLELYLQSTVDTCSSHQHERQY